MLPDSLSMQMVLAYSRTCFDTFYMKFFLTITTSIQAPGQQFWTLLSNRPGADVSLCPASLINLALAFPLDRTSR